MEETWKFAPCLLAFIAPESSMQAAGGGKSSIVLPAVNPVTTMTSQA